MRKDTDSRRGKPTTTPGRDAAELRRQKPKPTWEGSEPTSTDAPTTDTVPPSRDPAADTEPGTLYPSGGAATRDSADDLIAERTSADEPRLLASGDTLPEEPVPGVSDTRTAADREVDAARSGHHGDDALRESGLDGHPTADPTHRAGRVEDTHWAHGDTDPAHRSGVADDGPGVGGPVPEEPTAIGSAKVPGAMTPDPVSPSDAVEPSPIPAEPARRLWTAGTSEGLHERWQALQLRFVDDPSAVASEARTLVDEAIRTLTAELTHRQRELDAWNDGTSPDTEQLRVAVQQYRDFFTFLLTR
ncbi:hypothetical protein [Longispora urticae]